MTLTKQFAQPTALHSELHGGDALEGVALDIDNGAGAC